MGSTELLVFIDMNSLIMTLNDLDRQVKVLDSIFVDTYSHLSEDSLNSYEAAIGFTEKQPLIDFNDFFLYSSLYQKIALEEEEWLDNELLDFSTDPDNHFIFEHSLRALLNPDCEVQIGDTIFKLDENGYFAIPNANLKTLELLDKKQDDYLSLRDVIYIGDDNDERDECRSNKSNRDYKTSGNYRIKWVVSHWNHPWQTRAAAKIDNYEKKGNRWKKYRSYCKAQVYGFISSPGVCYIQFNFNPDMVYADAVHKHLEHKIIVATKTQSGWVKSKFWGPNSIYHSRTLTWQ